MSKASKIRENLRKKCKNIEPNMGLMDDSRRVEIPVVRRYLENMRQCQELEEKG
ncbi:hypothetical protein [Kiloniella litopenaei]|uniref:hypothetical protein n=1 Tax=Kiloniella litopenaei TaxID=1549748 RepID=UPI0012FF5369|nr:hypothetical protein [Kiloniella litopenaei]